MSSDCDDWHVYIKQELEENDIPLQSTTIKESGFNKNEVNYPQNVDKKGNKSTQHASLQVCNNSVIQDISAMKADYKNATKVNNTVGKSRECSICKAQFKRKSALGTHMKTHGKEPFQQHKVCKARFTIKGTLQSHVKFHADEKSFKCDTCEACFATSTALKKHSLTHTGVKEYKCSVCDKKFTRNANVKLHMKTHAVEKPFYCTVCNKRFSENNELSKHMRLHTDVKPFECKVCQEGFVSITENRKKHLRHIMLHCFKENNSANKTVNEICMVYGNGATSVQTVRSWFKKFRVGNFNLEDTERCGRPSTTDTDLIKAMVEENPRFTIREVADALKIPRTTVHDHLIKLGYVNRSDVWLPHNLTVRS